MKKSILILLLLIPIISYSQVYVRSAETMYFDEGWVNLAQYFPNGIILPDSDISDELQEALATNKNVIIPKNTTTSGRVNYYVTKKITITNSGQIIQGSGRGGNTWLVCDTDTMFQIQGAWDVVFRDIVINGNNRMKIGIYADTTDGGANRPVFENIRFEGFHIGGGDTAYAIYLNYVLYPSFYGCRFFQGDIGVYGYVLNAGIASGCIFVDNYICGMLIETTYFFTIIGGSCETIGKSKQHLFIFKDSYIDIYGLYTEPAGASDIRMLGDFNFVNIYGGRIGIIDCDSGMNVGSSVYLNVINTWIDLPDSSYYPDIPIISSLEGSKINLENVIFVKANYGNIGKYTILNYKSTMEKGEYYRLWNYLYSEKATHKMWINNN